ncbi:MAG TPA: helix-turn-helix domain-containing protein [Solirubrobacterales bacterium]|nr:helix-turn-helix domain-containing protein [Solirubrobacterales bacterium]
MGKARVQRRGHGSRSGEAARAEVAARLRERLPEIQEAVGTRVYAISDPHQVADPAYVEGLKAALAAAVEYRLAVLELGERRAPAVPEVLLAQARLDARDGVPLDTVLRRYFAGNTQFGDFLVEEAERAEVPSASVRGLLREQATLGDRLLAAVSAEHAREAKSRPSTSVERRRELVKSLLAGELVDSSELGYDLDGHHLALMAKGDGVEEPMRALASRLDRRLLLVQREEETKWACWLGGRRELGAGEALRALGEIAPKGTFVTVGEPAEGLAGWRFSHLQAKAALAIAERRREPVLRYADVAVVASILRDDLVATSLRQLYLEPLAQSRDNGKVARETLRAYFDAERNISSTAAALGVDRRTVRNRLRSIEGLLGRPLRGSMADLEIALRLEE